MKGKILEYANKFPLKSFREPERCAANKNDCSGTYFPDSGHSNFKRLFSRHITEIGELSPEINPVFFARFF